MRGFSTDLEPMTFQDALKILGIEDYEKRIYNSNSYGELFHIMDYIEIAQSYKNLKWFRKWFEILVKGAERTWKRPESIFQHIGFQLEEDLKIKRKMEQE